MKCISCMQRKGKRTCRVKSGLICRTCCEKNRDIKVCGSECEYMQEKYTRIDASSIELTEVGRGKVITFSDSLFLPNVLECYYCDVEQMTINIMEPTRISLYAKFVFRNNTSREISPSETYKVDAWKKSQDISKGMPFLQIYSLGMRKITNVQLASSNCQEKISIENNHLDTWLPNAYTRTEKITSEENLAIFHGDIKTNKALVYHGEYFWGGNSTLFSEIKVDTEYTLNLEIIYEKPQFQKKEITLPFGVFWPCRLVNYKKFNIYCQSNLELDTSSKTMLLLPFKKKVIVGNMIPLQQNQGSLSSAGYIPYETKSMDKTFHYDNYCILYNNFVIGLKTDVVIKSLFSELPILTGLYDSVNKVYDDEYAPVKVIICNNSSRIEKYVIEVEILGISYKCIKEVFVDAYKVKCFEIAPKLNDEKIRQVRINKECDIWVKVEDDSSKILYNETGQCLLYPREVFAETLKNKTKDWKLDLKSFIARWITPTIPEIDEIIAGAGREINKSMLGSGNSSNDLIQKEMKGIYDYLSKKINYVARPLAFSDGEYHVQKISLPSTTIKLNSGNCIDLSILLASCYEALKLRTAIVLIPGHAFLKVYLDDTETVFLESTYMGKKEYYEAVESATDKYREYFDENGPTVDNAAVVELDIARKSKILPME